MGYMLVVERRLPWASELASRPEITSNKPFALKSKNARLFDERGDQAEDIGEKVSQRRVHLAADHQRS